MANRKFPLTMKQRREYCKKEYFKGRALRDIAEDKMSDGQPYYSLSSLHKISHQEKWYAQREALFMEKKEELKEELLVGDLDFQKKFLDKANTIIEKSMYKFARDGFKDERALVMFIKFLEEYKDKIKNIEPTIKIKTEITSDKDQLEMIKTLNNTIAQAALARAKSLNDYVSDSDEIHYDADTDETRDDV